VSASVNAGRGLVKCLDVTEADVGELSVSVTDPSDHGCADASLTTLPGGQLGTLLRLSLAQHLERACVQTVADT